MHHKGQRIGAQIPFVFGVALLMCIIGTTLGCAEFLVGAALDATVFKEMNEKRAERLRAAASEKLFTAADKGDYDKMSRFLRHGGWVDVRDEHGETLLMKAANKGHLRVVSLLLDKRADVNLKDDNGRTALSMAVDAGHLDVIDALIAAGAVGQAKNDIGVQLDQSPDGGNTQEEK
jgi:hypothetical protein